MTAGSRSSPPITRAGSPGKSCCSEKIRMDTKNSVGTSWAIRRARKFSMTALVSRARRNMQGCDAEPGPMFDGSRLWVPDQHRIAGALQCIQDARAFASASLQLQPDHAYEPVRHLLVAFEPVGMRDQDAAMVEVKDGLVV